MELEGIPQLLQLGPDASHIESIRTIKGRDAYQYKPGLWRIDCWLDVRWSNGTIDHNYKYSVWMDRYGQYQGTYGRN